MIYRAVRSISWPLIPFLLTALFVSLPQSVARTNTFEAVDDAGLDDRIPSPISFSAAPGTSLATQTIFFQDRLVALAKYYASLVHVPYIWGGQQVGSTTQCIACRSCVQEKKVPLMSRLGRCRACQQCGMDCSHFVYRMYHEAGLDYNYASTSELSRQTGPGLLKYYNFVDIGRDLTLAQPGDLLVYKKHIMMLMRVVSPKNADFIHITRFGGDGHKLGGIRFETGRSVERFRGSLVRILRHKRFFEDPTNFSMLPSFNISTANLKQIARK